jgi:hypothetical protein
MFGHRSMITVGAAEAIVGYKAGAQQKFTAGASIDVTMPTYAAGDTVYVAIYLESGAGTLPTTPSGWTVLASASSLYFYGKTMTGSEGASVNFGGVGGSSRLVVAAATFSGGTMELAAGTSAVMASGTSNPVSANVTSTGATSNYYVITLGVSAAYTLDTNAGGGTWAPGGGGTPVENFDNPFPGDAANGIPVCCASRFATSLTAGSSTALAVTLSGSSNVPRCATTLYRVP